MPTIPAGFKEDDRFPPVRITKTGVQIGGTAFEYPAGKPAYIKERGIEIQPGGAKAINELTVTFYVGEISLDDDTLDRVKVNNACQS